MTRIARIVGTGSYLPERVLTNEDLTKMVETNDEWIVSRTGMKERRLAAAGEYASHMGVHAARKALEAAGKGPEDIDMILVTTSTPDYIFPSTAALIQAELKASTIPCMDLQAACTGFVYGLVMAKAFVTSGMYHNVLVIATEKLSSFVNYTDRRTCILFGDGAGAALVSAQGKGLSIDESCLGADGSVAELVKIQGGGSRYPPSAETLEKQMHFIEMDGQEVFKHAVRRMEAAARACLNKANKTTVDWLIPHQANERILDAMVRRFELEPHKVVKTVHKYGNTSASSVAIALDELVREGKVTQGQNLLLVAFGAGLTWGAILLTEERVL